MNDEIEKRVVAFVRRELGRVSDQEITIDADLVKVVDWPTLHEDERIPSFLCDFCHEFEIEHDFWEPPRKTKGLFSKLFKRGPDVQFFLSLDVAALPVRGLVDMAREKHWRFPV